MAGEELKACPLAPALSCALGEPQGNGLDSWGAGVECGETEAQGPRAQRSELMVLDSGPKMSLSVIQPSWAGSFDKGLSLKTLKEKQPPEGADTTEPRRLADTQ